MVVRGRDAAGNPEVLGDNSPVSDAVTFTVGIPAPGPDVAAAPHGPLTAPDSVLRLADGLHISTGAIQAPDGSIWVADHNAGLCRVSKPTFDGAGHITTNLERDALVEQIKERTVYRAHADPG